jgi:cardiolipin synthase
LSTDTSFRRRVFATPFPWRDENRFQLHIDGSQYLSRMLETINVAQRSISLEMYLCASGRVFEQFRDALAAAAQRGVAVRINLDGFGSLQVSQVDRDALRNAGVQLKFYNPIRLKQGLKNLLRNHRKVLVVDGTVAFTGGAGLSDEFLFDRATEPAWHDLMLEISGPCALDWQTLFDHTWRGLQRKRDSYRPIRVTPASTPAPQSTNLGRVVTSYGPQAHHVLQSLYQRIASAHHRAWIATPYFVPSWKFRQRLMQAARRGVDVRILVPGQHTDHPALRQASRHYFAGLLHHGVRIFEYQPRFVHAKVALCDGWSTVGSTNFDRWNLRWNLDANQEVDDINFATQLGTMLDYDFAQSIELHKQDWQQRPWYQRWQEQLTGWLERWSDRLR